jgi:NAD(P)-dependent dehydrogenase (short-subunit alcohol dehydrogenase family)
MSGRARSVGVVTGGSSGIGFAVARKLHDSGMAVVLVGRQEQRGREAVRKLQGDAGTAEFVSIDVACEADVTRLFAGVRARFGRLDFIFNGAGAEGAGVAPPSGWSEQHCEQVLGVNVKGTFVVLKHGVPLMLESNGGAIVNAASFVGTIVPILDAAMYGASKAAVMSLTRAVASGYGPQGIRCYAIAPWVTDTPMVDRLTQGGGVEAKAGLAATFNPSGKLVDPVDVARIVYDMFSQPDAYANGDIVLIDSGGKTERVEAFAIGGAR